MRLRTRMALISATAVAVVVIVAVVLAQQVARRELMGEIDQSLVDRVDAIGSALGQGQDADDFGEAVAGRAGRFRRVGPEDIFGRGGSGFDAVFYQVVFADGRVRAPTDQPVELPVEPIDLALAGQPSASIIRTVGDGDDRVRMITASVPGAAIQFGRSLQEVDETLAGVTGTLTLAGLVGVALAGLLGLVVARSALRPVDDLTKTVEHVAKTRELAARIDVERDDEIGRLARSFNGMLEALEESQVQQQQLVRDAGHELRTPLTALRTNIELLARAETLDDHERREVLDAAAFELRELSDLSAELVDLAADPTVVTEPRQTERIDDLIDRVAERFRWRTGRPINVQAEPFSAEVGITALERAVSNLVDNAHKWSPEGAPITIEARVDRIAVTDQGSGIREEDKKRIFDRFYRADTARTTPGSGLGLAIVKKVVEELGGDVFVESSDGMGATVGFTLPAEIIREA